MFYSHEPLIKTGCSTIFFSPSKVIPINLEVLEVSASPLGYNFMLKNIVFEMIFEVCWKSFFFLQPPLRLVLLPRSSKYSTQILMKSISHDALEGQCSHLALLSSAGVNR